MFRLTRAMPIILLLAGCAGDGGMGNIRAGGDAYQFRGSDPAWTMSIDPRVIIFDNGSSRVVETAVVPVVENGRRTYRTGRVTASAVAGRCTSAGDGGIYTESVQVVVDGRSYSGCGGRVLAADQIDGSVWRVQSVKGQPLDAGTSASFRFDDDRFTARFPCTTVTGRYVQSGVIMSLGQVRKTAGTCVPGPTEQEVPALLDGLLTVTWSSADRLTLSHPTGAIVLQR